MRNFAERHTPVWAPDDVSGAAPGGPSSSGASSESESSGSSPQPAVPPAPGGSDTSGTTSSSDEGFSFLEDVFGPGPTSTTLATPAQAVAPGTEAQPQTPLGAAQQAQPSASAPAPVPAQSQAQPGQTEGQPPSQSAFDPADPVSLAKGLLANYDAAVAHLASGPFALSPQDMEALETNVAGEVPKLLAKVAVYMQAQVLTQMGRIVPQMLQRHGEVERAHTKHVDDFYAAWPSIDRAKHHAVVSEIGAMFRRMNPDMPTSQMIEALGPFILHRLGLPLVAMTKAGASQATPRPANGRATHFQPAAPGAVTGQQSPEAAGAYDFLSGQG